MLTFSKHFASSRQNYYLNFMISNNSIKNQIVFVMSSSEPNCISSPSSLRLSAFSSYWNFFLGKRLGPVAFTGCCFELGSVSCGSSLEVELARN